MSVLVMVDIARLIPFRSASPPPHHQRPQHNEAASTTVEHMTDERELSIMTILKQAIPGEAEAGKLD